jgi:hypothetical protein
MVRALTPEVQRLSIHIQQFGKIVQDPNVPKSDSIATQQPQSLFFTTDKAVCESSAGPRASHARRFVIIALYRDWKRFVYF